MSIRHLSEIMSEDVDLNKAAMAAEDEEIVVKEIATYIIDDLILEFCFEIHKEVKLGYIESNSENKYHRESKSLTGSFPESKLWDLNTPSMSQENKVSDQQEKDYPKETDSEILLKYSMPFEAGISCTNVNLINSVSVKSEENIKDRDCFEQSERAKEKSTKLSVMKSSLSEAIKYNRCNLNNLKSIMHIPQLNIMQSKILCEVMNEAVSKKNGSTQDSDVWKLNNMHKKFSAKEVKQISSLVHLNKLNKSLEFQRYDNLIKLEKEWIEEAYDSPGCKNSKSFQDWMQIIESTQTKDNKTGEERNIKDVLVDKEIKCCAFSERREQVFTDVFGNPEKSLRNIISKKTCTCPVCGRKTGAVRFAYHLGTCMGLGRRRSQRSYSVTKRNKR